MRIRMIVIILESISRWIIVWTVDIQEGFGDNVLGVNLSRSEDYEEYRVICPKRIVLLQEKDMVEFRDGAVIAQLGTPDMRLPIRYALTYPRRAASALPALDLLSCPPLTFAPPDLQAFPCLKLAMDCARTGGTSCAVLNGANEAAVDLFRREEIAFGRIPELVENALNSIPVKSNPSLEDILEADRQAREAVYSDK